MQIGGNPFARAAVVNPAHPVFVCPFPMGVKGPLEAWLHTIQPA